MKSKINRIMEKIGLRRKVRSSGRFAVDCDDLSPLSRVWDHQTGQLWHFETPTKYDHWTVSSVFLSKDYAFDSAPRGASIRKYYDFLSAKAMPLIIDAGANIGASPTLFSALYPNARIVALEPVKRNIELHKRNCKSTNVYLEEAALGREAGICRINESDNPRSGSISEDGSQQARVLSATDLLYRNRDHSPFIIKIDIEGQEADLFAGDTSWIDNFPVIVVEPHDWKFPGECRIRPFISAISKLNRDLLISGECLLSVCNRRITGL